MYMHLYLVILFALTILVPVCSLDCLDNSGEKVPWWVMFKLPRLSKDKDNRVNKGYGFAYIDAHTDDDGVFSLYETPIDDDNNPVALARTLSQVFGKNNYSFGEIMRLRHLESTNNGSSFILYNDQTEEKVISSTWGHSKGVIAYDGHNGLWLTHSAPKYPNIDQNIGLKFPVSEAIYGQHFFCISMDKYDLNNLATQLKYVRPWIYFDGFSKIHLKDLPAIYDLINKKQINDGTNVSLRKLKAVGDSKTTFIHFAKNKHWNQDLWDNLISVHLEEDMLVESWIRGNNIGPKCSDFHVNNVKKIHIFPSDGENSNGWTWLESQDHSKWGIGSNHQNKWVCFGDINRMTTQRKRAGGAICFKNAAIWNRLSNAIVNTEQCD